MRRIKRFNREEREEAVGKSVELLASLGEKEGDW